MGDEYDQYPESRPHIMREHFYKGIAYPNIVLDSCLDKMRNFEVRPDDVWIVTYPKSGTHWLAEIASLVHTRGKPEEIDRPALIGLVETINLKQKFPKTREEEIASPVNMSTMMDVIDKARSPRVIMTHLFPDQLPTNLFQTAKVIYVARNAKDSIVSWYNMKIKAPHYFNRSWEDVFTRFLEGNGMFGSWPKHVKAFWELRNEKNVLFLFFDELRKESDPTKYIKQVAEHIGVQLTDEEMQKVVEHSTIKGMKKSYKQTATKDGDSALGTQIYLNKGLAGGWKNVFTVAQNEYCEDWLKREMADSGIGHDLY